MRRTNSKNVAYSIIQELLLKLHSRNTDKTKCQVFCKGIKQSCTLVKLK